LIDGIVKFEDRGRQGKFISVYAAEVANPVAVAPEAVAA
jgi:hypothetical protein